MWRPSNRFRRILATAIIFTPLLLCAFTMLGPFWGPLLSRAVSLMPSRVAGNWTEVFFGVGIFIVAQIFSLLWLGWPEMRKKWKESIGIGVLSVAVGWVALFCWSFLLEIGDIHMVASKIEAPKVHTPGLPRGWDQRNPLLKPSQNSAVPNFKGTIEGIFFLVQTPLNEGCVGVVAVVSANIKNNGTPSIADIGEIFAVLPNGRKIELTVMIPPAEGIAIQAKPGGRGVFFPAKDYLHNKAVEQPIPTGGETYGWLWGCAKGVALAEINNPASKIIVPFTDFKGRSYTVHASLSDKQFEVVNP
jgi:hypothetical protein